VRFATPDSLAVERAFDMGLRARLLLLVLLPVIPALVLALYTNLEERRFGAFGVEKDAIRVVQLAAANQLALIEATRQHLAALSRFPQARHNDLAAFDLSSRTCQRSIPITSTSASSKRTAIWWHAPWPQGFDQSGRPGSRAAGSPNAGLRHRSYQAGEGSVKPSLTFDIRSSMKRADWLAWFMRLWIWLC